MKKREFINKAFTVWSWSCSWIAFIILILLLGKVLKEGLPWLNSDFLTSFPSRFPHKAGLLSALWGSFWIMLLTSAWAIPLGIGAAIYIEEYAPKKSKLISIVKINIANLAGMPSIVYGLLGLSVFVRFSGMGRSLLAGSLTLALLILPVIIISAQEAIKAVPRQIREAAFALGARPSQVVFLQVLPCALPGIMTGIILSLSRAIGESAPLIMIGALSFVAFVPESPFDAFTVLPVQIFNWASRPQLDFQGLAAAGSIVLLILLFSLNFLAFIIRFKKNKRVI